MNRVSTELAIFANPGRTSYRVAVRRITDKRPIAFWGGFTSAAELATAIRADGRPVGHIPPELAEALANHGVTTGPQFERSDPAVDRFLKECGL